MEELDCNKALNAFELRQAQKIMLYISKNIHRVCVKHNIKYWLDWGSLLGCIRHGGFIPWDDDMDICMLREDYEKFLKVAQDELGDEFFVQHSGSDPRFPFVYTKVRLEGTCWKSYHWKDANLKSYGIWVDIFPMDSYPKSRFMVRFITFWKSFYKHTIGWSYGHRSPHPIKKHIQHLMAILLPVKVAKFLVFSLVKSLKLYKNSGYHGMFCMNTARSLCRTEVFRKLVLKKFEDTEFYIPENYEERLTGLYGDYMKLPPPELRINYHKIIKLDFGKYKDL